MEEDVLQAESLLPSQRGVQRHPALLHTLPHPLLEGRLFFSPSTLHLMETEMLELGREKTNSTSLVLSPGHRASVHSQQPRELHHVALPSRLYQPFQLLIPPPQPKKIHMNCLYILYIEMYNIVFSSTINSLVFLVAV